VVADVPEIAYAKTQDGAHIAYQVLGVGPPDVVYANSFMGHIEVSWEYPPAVDFYHRLASFCRLVLFDRRGTGLSDPIVDHDAIEDRSADLGAVIDALGLEHPVLLGSSEGGMTCSHYAALHPERVKALVLFSTPARLVGEDRRTASWSPEVYQTFLDSLDAAWADPTGSRTALVNPSLANDPKALAWYARYFRLSASPALVRTLAENNVRIAIAHLLPMIAVPTLVLHRTHETWLPVAGSRYMADQIVDAKLIELPGTDHYIWEQNAATVVDEIEEFLTGVRRERTPLRLVKTLVFTDIVGSTALAGELHDEQWHRLLDRHDAALRRQVERFSGRVVNTTGDGALATFDGPAAAIRCGLAIRDAMRALDLPVRVGVHTGEVDVRGEDVGGIAVHIAARVSDLAATGEVLVSRTVADLVTGSGTAFTDRGEHELKGVAGTWRLFAVEG
jgi:class 3 adenylate cyclase